MGFPRLFVAVAGAVLALTACAAEADNSVVPAGTGTSSTASELVRDDQRHNKSEAKPEKPAETTGPVPWVEGPVDGTWKSGDVSFGRPTPIRTGMAGPRDEYVFTISEPPILTTEDAGATVTMTSTVHVTRIHDRGFDEDLSDRTNIWFRPGNLSYSRHHEAYGLRTDVECEKERLLMGESTTCTASFSAPADEIQDSNWTISGFEVGAWPSQLAADD